MFRKARQFNYGDDNTVFYTGYDLDKLIITLLPFFIEMLQYDWL